MAVETTQILSSILYGLIEGSLYGLLGVGLSLALGVMKIINLAHGPLAVLGAYLFFSFIAYLGILPVASALLSLVVVSVIGLVIYLCLIDRIVTVESSTLIVTYGLEIVIGNLLLSMFTGATRTVDLELGSLNIGGIFIGLNRLLALVVAFTSIIVLDFVSKKTYLGKAMRATAEDIEAAELMGVNTRKIYALSYLLCAFLAALFGLCFITTHSVDPLTGSLLNIKAFTITVLSGGNLGLALAAGLLLGFSEIILTTFVIPTAYQHIIAFAILLIVLTTMYRRKRE